MSNWEDLSELDQLRDMYSDAFKEVYGVRPRGGAECDWTVEDYAAALRMLAEG